MEPRYSKNYLKEFLRTVAPQGVMIFDLPSELNLDYKGPSGVAEEAQETRKPLVGGMLLDLFRKLGGNRRQEPGLVEPMMEMHAVSQEEVIELLEENGARVVDIVPDRSAGPHWLSFRYCVTKE